ncbi:MAG TPA: UvrD-helicase domain-containing protein [Pseudolabrys sp.]|nr:UvrD-helicase domain-containing protein [Pseudolabrys sp.]
MAPPADPFEITDDPAPVDPQPQRRAVVPNAHLEGLNEEQRQAVVHEGGPLLVLAGAGTGKTRVLTTRIAHILNLGRAHPSQILAVTFTNKAAREMKERVGQMVGQIVEGMPWLGTFHSIGVKILRRHAEMVGLKNNFTILDVDDQIRVIKQILEAEKLDEKRWPARVLAMLIDGWKNRGLMPEQVPSGEAASFANGKGKKLYMAYQERLKTLNAADFGDLLLENIRLFRQNADVLRSFQERFRFILVDEYQDTNVAQYLWLKLLAQTTNSQPSTAVIPGRGEATDPESSTTALSPSSPGRREAPSPGDPRLADLQEDVDGRNKSGHDAPENVARPAITNERLPKNICCVGDDDQSIYGWRGAEVDNILRFDHDFPGAKVIRLERNYRSTGHILAAASHLIAHNEGRLGKTLRTEDVLGEKVQVTGAWDSEEEARAIGEEIEQLQREARERGEDHPLDEIAILVRASFQMREFEDRFIQLGLPYRVIGGPRFYERAEIRDALAYLRVIAQPADDLAFERIVNVPKRGLGDATVQMLHDYARKKRIPLTEAASALSATDEMKPKPRQALRDLMTSFESWRLRKDSMPHTELAEIVLDESGYTDMWQKDRSADAAGRLENLKELVRSMEEFENLQGFLEHISLVMDREGNEAEQAVNIMTLHSAKGLEFDCVFLPGWEEGLFPHQRSLDESGRAGLEEERRLAHVGLTRARKLAKIYFATNRRIHGLWTSTVPSRFLDELPEAHVEVKEAPGGGFGMSGYGASRFDEMNAFGSGYTTPGWQRAQARKGKGGYDETGRYRGPGGGFYDNGQPRYVPDGVYDDADAENIPPLKGKTARGARREAQRKAPLTIEGELVAKSTGTVSSFTVGERVFHQKFGNGNVVAVDGNKLTIAFDKAGEKRVVDGFVERA